MPRLSFIIPAYNEEKWIGRSISAIHRSAAPHAVKYEVIVVDNNSTDDTEQRATEKGARVVLEPVRQISRVRNRGAAAANGDVLIFVDADTLVNEQLVGQTARLMCSDEAVGGGATVRSDRSLRDALETGMQVWNTISVRFRLAAGSYLFCRRDVFEALNGFNERMYAAEEIDLSLRLKRRGARLNLPFVIIQEAPVITSARKTEWYSGYTLLLNFFMSIFFPWAVYFKTLCGFWYDRPEEPDRDREDR